MLHDAVRGNDVKGLLKGIRNGCDVNVVDPVSGSSALRFAALRGSVECVRLLLESKAEVDMMSGNRETPLRVAARQGHTECVRVLLAHGADVNIRQCYSPLHCACLHAHLQCVEVEVLPFIVFELVSN